MPAPRKKNLWLSDFPIFMLEMLLKSLWPRKEHHHQLSHFHTCLSQPCNNISIPYLSNFSRVPTKCLNDLICLSRRKCWFCYFSCWLPSTFLNTFFYLTTWSFDCTVSIFLASVYHRHLSGDRNIIIIACISTLTKVTASFKERIVTSLHAQKKEFNK